MNRKKTQQTEDNEVLLNSTRDIIEQVVKKKSKSKFLTENQKIYYETL